MNPDSDTVKALGQEVVTDGRLRDLRLYLGLTRNAMAELLHTNLVTYSDWERRPKVRLRPQTAARVGRFYQASVRGLELLRESGQTPEELMPFHVVATQLGIPQELLLERYRDGRVAAIDAGILGLWIRRADLPSLRGRR